MSLKDISLTGPIRSEMTTEQLARQNRLVDAAVKRIEAERDGRADAYGLIEHVHFDDANRKIREWSSVDGHIHWMDPFRQSVTSEMVRINNRQTTPEENQEFLAQWSAVHKRG